MQKTTQIKNKLKKPSHPKNKLLSLKKQVELGNQQSPSQRRECRSRILIIFFFNFCKLSRQGMVWQAKNVRIILSIYSKFSKVTNTNSPLCIPSDLVENCKFSNRWQEMEFAVLSGQ